MGKIGDDDNGRFMLDQLAQLGIGTAHIVVDPAVQTGITMSLTYPEEKAQITFPGSIAAYSLADVDLAALGGFAHLHLASMYLQTNLRPAFPTLLRRAKDMGLSTSLDPGWDPAAQWGTDLSEALAAVDILFVNEHEAKSIAKADSASAGAGELARRVPLVVAKLGADGALMASRDGIIVVRPHKVTVLDTTGAGDSFAAGFVYLHVVQGRPAVDALRFANACGALAVTRLGGASSVPSEGDVGTFLAAATDAEVRHTS